MSTPVPRRISDLAVSSSLALAVSASSQRNENAVAEQSTMRPGRQEESGHEDDDHALVHHSHDSGNMRQKLEDKRAGVCEADWKTKG